MKHKNSIIFTIISFLIAAGLLLFIITNDRTKPEAASKIDEKYEEEHDGLFADAAEEEHDGLFADAAEEEHDGLFADAAEEEHDGLFADAAEEEHDGLFADAAEEEHDGLFADAAEEEHDGLFADAAEEDPGKEYDEATLNNEDEAARENAVSEPPAPSENDTSDTLRIIAVGDNLIHNGILDDGIKSDGTRNYDFLYSNIRDYISDADVKIINQETVIVPEIFGYSGYPFFGTPQEVADAVIRAGFNVATLATNHAFDKGDPAKADSKELTEEEKTGPDGLLASLEYWAEHSDSITVTGAYADSDSYNTLTVREYNGIRIAFLNYTYWINFQDTAAQIALASGYVKYLDPSLYVKEIKAARKLADLVIVLPHWGVEYDPLPSDSQKRMAQEMADAGADIIIGTHPHVVQPFVTIRSNDGRDVPCFYSLGNFVANMTRPERQLELMAEIVIEKTEEGVTLTEAKATPLVNHISGADEHFTVYLLEDYTEELASEHFYNPETTDNPPVSVEGLWAQYYAEVLSD